MIFLIFSVSMSFSNDLKNDRKYYEIISNILNSIDYQNENSLYEAQQLLMLPLFASFEMNDNRIKSLLISGLIKSLNKMTDLGKLRNDAKFKLIKLDEKLLNSGLSGNDYRKIFAVRKKDPKNNNGILFNRKSEDNITESVLSELQFLYLVSSACRYIIKYEFNNGKKLTDEESIFIKRSFDILLNSIIIPFWVEVEAWHWKKNFRNMKERAIARLDQNNRELSGYSYYRVFFDEDKHFFAITADLIFIIESKLFEKLDIKITEEQKSTVYEIRDITLKIMKDRISAGDDFIFQKGMWYDHPDYQYSGCNSSERPDKKVYNKNIAEDTAHSHRWPWWLSSYRDSWTNDEKNYNYFKLLLKRLSDQLADKVININNSKVLFNNFMDGTNGWFRINYQNNKSAYGPYTLSHSAVYGSWFMLAEFNDKIKEFNKLLHEMSVSKDKIMIDFRTSYYGKNYNTPENNGMTIEDLYGKESIYDYYFKIAEYFGYY